ncbi:MAG: bifunctional heptose 7-phosphate kinase/heptose 1-phosphate adenyltransferase [Planctomycetota bacterium]|jgi:D-beta-D-heptose 7-phosphate kinase/D-beta-D-heptose 1-phosphate adenosyltransferase
MNKDLLLAAVQKIPSLNILVIGDLMLDVYDFCYSTSSRPSPEKKNKLVYTSHKTIRTLGGAGNVAANLTSLGTKTKLLSIAGNDGHFLTLQNLAEDAQLSHTIVKDINRPTTTKFRLYIDDEYILRRDDEEVSEVDGSVAEQLQNEFLKALSDCDAVIISDYNKGVFTKTFSQFIITNCNEKKIPVIVDFKPDNMGYFEGADIIAPNETEAKMLNSSFCSSNPEDGVKKLYDQLNCSNVIVTLGASGICGYDESEYFQLPAFKVNAIDPVGCGDTVRSGLAAGYSLGLNLKESATVANAAAAVVVQKTGTATLNINELTSFISDNL